MFKTLIPGLVAATGVALIAGGAALAFGGGGEKPDEELLADVAERLGIEDSVLQDAFDQAKRERADEEIGAWLDELVEAETITRAQADEALEWVASRPESASAISPFGIPSVLLRAGSKFERKLFIAPQHLPLGTYEFNPPPENKEKLAERLGIDVDELEGAFSEAGREVAKDARRDALKTQIDRLVEVGRLTEDEGVELNAWLDEMPEWLATGNFAWPFLDGGILRLRHAVEKYRRFETPDGFVVPDGHYMPQFRFEFRPRRFPFGEPEEAWLTPSGPEAGATGAFRPA